MVLKVYVHPVNILIFSARHLVLIVLVVDMELVAQRLALAPVNVQLIIIAQQGVLALLKIPVHLVILAPPDLVLPEIV